MKQHWVPRSSRPARGPAADHPATQRAAATGTHATSADALLGSTRLRAQRQVLQARFGLQAVQRSAIEEQPLQGRGLARQLASLEEEEPLQGHGLLQRAAPEEEVSPKADNAKITELSRDIQDIKRVQDNQGKEVNNLRKTITTVPAPAFKAGGSGFLIDGKGYLVTNAHIIRNSKNIVVINNKGEQFKAVLQKYSPINIAILKIDDEAYKSVGSLPYGIRKLSTDVAEPIYTLGYPRNEIVYSEGYLSAKTGFNGDTLSCQLGIAANRGNSGGPVFNQDGEVIGVISTKEMEAEGVAFAIQSKFIYNAIDELKKDTSYQSLKLPAKSSVRGLNKKDQVKKIQDYVFMVKGD